MITSHDLDNFGKQAADAFLTDKTALSTSIEKTASENGLNFHQVSRVVEAANTKTYLQLIKTSSDNYVDFPLADAKEIHNTISAPTEKSASADDYMSPPITKDTVGTSDFAKEASTKTRSISEIEKDAKYIEGVHTFLVDASQDTRYEFIDTYEDVWSLTKQAVLGDRPFNDVVEVIKNATPNYSSFISEDFKEHSKKALPFTDLTKEASSNGMINPSSDLHIKCEHLEYLGDRYTKILDAAVSYEDKYTELEKEAAGIGSGLKKITIGAGQTVGGVVGKALQALNKPLVVIGGLGLGLSYWGGKSKGRAEQGEILQSRMLSPKYRRVLEPLNR
ncbi:MAG: hypothetical protein H8E12_16885 [Rhodobacteraceae bacterium]|nr:hypothetical protein [Paracoccaceae bacterium]